MSKFEIGERVRAVHGDRAGCVGEVVNRIDLPSGTVRYDVKFDGDRRREIGMLDWELTPVSDEKVSDMDSEKKAAILVAVADLPTYSIQGLIDAGVASNPDVVEFLKEVMESRISDS